MNTFHIIVFITCYIYCSVLSSQPTIPIRGLSDSHEIVVNASLTNLKMNISQDETLLSAISENLLRTCGIEGVHVVKTTVESNQLQIILRPPNASSTFTNSEVFVATFIVSVI